MQSATIQHLDLSRFEDEYLPRAVGTSGLEKGGRSTRKCLAAAKMIASVDDPTPTVGGMLILGKRPHDFLPGAYIRFRRVAEPRSNREIIDEETCCYGSISAVVNQVEEKFVSHDRTVGDLRSGWRETRHSMVPLEALRQLVRNAVMHRTYEYSNAPVCVTWLDDRIEISSPGKPYGAVGSECLGLPSCVDYRNPFLAESMRVLGLVRKVGLGIETAKHALRENGNPDPEFRVKRDSVQCIVGSRS